MAEKVCAKINMMDIPEKVRLWINPGAPFLFKIPILKIFTLANVTFNMTLFTLFVPCFLPARSIKYKEFPLQKHNLVIESEVHNAYQTYSSGTSSFYEGVK